MLDSMLDTTRYLNDVGVVFVDDTHIMQSATLLQMNHMAPNITDTFDSDSISVAVL